MIPFFLSCLSLTPALLLGQRRKKSSFRREEATSNTDIDSKGSLLSCFTFLLNCSRREHHDVEEKERTKSPGEHMRQHRKGPTRAARSLIHETTHKTTPTFLFPFSWCSLLFEGRERLLHETCIRPLLLGYTTYLSIVWLTPTPSSIDAGKDVTQETQNQRKRNHFSRNMISLTVSRDKLERRGGKGKETITIAAAKMTNGFSGKSSNHANCPLILEADFLDTKFSYEKTEGVEMTITTVRHHPKDNSSCLFQGFSTHFWLITFSRQRKFFAYVFFWLPLLFLQNQRKWLRKFFSFLIMHWWSSEKMRSKLIAFERTSRGEGHILWFRKRIQFQAETKSFENSVTTLNTDGRISFKMMQLFILFPNLRRTCKSLWRRDTSV